MILIISSIYDTSTDTVIDWLHSYKIPFLRINEDFIYEMEVVIDASQSKFIIHGVDLSTVKVVWFRKHGFYVDYFDLKYITERYSFELTNFILNETGAVRKLVIDYLLSNSSIKWLGKPAKLPINKPFALNIAKQIGLNIPDTFIVSNKDSYQEILNFDLNNYIIKPISDVLPIPINSSEHLIMLTTMFDSEDNLKLPSKAIPSIIQKKISKKFEVRAFCIDGKIFATKIIEAESKLDHRFNLFDQRTRFETYDFTESDKQLLNRLLAFFDLNCASVDFIVDEHDKLFFLEINPTGQFGYHSRPNNYSLDKIIAEHLKQLYNE